MSTPRRAPIPSQPLLALLPPELTELVISKLPLRPLSNFALTSATSGRTAQRVALQEDYWHGEGSPQPEWLDQVLCPTTSHELRWLVTALAIRMEPTEALPLAMYLWRVVGGRWGAVRRAAPIITDMIAEGVCGGLLRKRWTAEQLMQLLLGHGAVSHCSPCMGLQSSAPNPKLASPANWQNLLTAVRDGSLDAAARLPEALNQLRDQPEAWMDASSLLSSCLPRRQEVLLRWAEHLVGLLEQPHGLCVAGTLVELASTVPEQLYFAFSARWPPPLEEGALDGLSTACGTAVRHIGELLLNPVLEGIQIGAFYLARPDRQIQDMLMAIGLHLKNGNRAAALCAYREMQLVILHPRPWHGGADCRGDQLRALATHLIPRLNALCGVEGQALQTVEPSAFFRQARMLITFAQRQIQMRGPVPLHSLSPILARYRASEAGTVHLSVPSACEGAMIVERFSDSVQFLETLEHPARIELICRSALPGTLGTACSFLVKVDCTPRLAAARQGLSKYGIWHAEDRTGSLMREFARVIDLDADCAAKGLRMRVDGLESSCIGSARLVKWCSNTQTLQESCRRQLIGDPARTELLRAGLPGPQDLLKLSPKAAAAHFNELLNRVPRTLLSMDLAEHCDSADAYTQMRSRTVRSLAAFTAVSYVLGIGNRHLDQFLIDQASGDIIPIDIDHINGSATALRIPELMGVRLTRQMLCTGGPPDLSRKAFAACLRTALHALRSAQPELQRSVAALANPAMATRVAARLLGEHPAHGTVADLRRTMSERALLHSNQQQLEASVLGPEGCLRRQVPPAALSVAEQVECLMEQAEDPVILGRTFPGWRAWF